MLPYCPMVTTNHYTVICLYLAFKLTNVSVSLDERCITATVKDLQGTVKYHTVNVYVLAQRKDRLSFIESLKSLPFVPQIRDGTWFLLGDFNLSIWKSTTVKHPRIQPWFERLRQPFFNCATDSTPTFVHGNRQSTIDCIFVSHSTSTCLTATYLHFLLPSWTDHCLLIVNLSCERKDLGPGVWHFNPAPLWENLLQNSLLKFSIVKSISSRNSRM